MQTTLIAQSHNGTDTAPKFFRIETGIPVPKRGQPPSNEIKEALLKLTYALNNMKMHQSIVVRNVSKTTIGKYVREELPEIKIRMQTVNKEKGWVRVWLMSDGNVKK